MSILRYFFIFGYFLMIIPPSFSQDKSNASETEKEVVTEKIKLIPAVDITSKIPGAINQVKQIKNSLISKEELYDEKSKLDAFLIEYSKFAQKHSLNHKAYGQQAKLQNELYGWKKQKEKLEEIENSFDNIKKELTDQKTELVRLKKLWKESYEAAKKEDLPRNAKNMVNSLLTEIQRVEYILNQKNDFVYKQLELIANTLIVINENIQDFDNHLRKMTEIMLLTKEPSLFHLIFGEEGKVIEKEKYSFSEIFMPIINYISDNFIIIFVHLLSLLILYVFLRTVKKKLQPDKYQNINAKLIHTVFEVLNRPFTTSFLIFLMSANIIYSKAPPVFHTFTYFLLLIPVMVLLPIITLKKLNFYIYGLGLIYLLTLFLNLHIVNPIASYLIILGAIVISLLGISKFVKRSILIRIFASKTSQTVVLFLFYIFALFLVVAFFAILMGYYTIGTFLFNNTIWSIYRFFLFYAGYVVLEGFSELLIYSNYVSKIKSVQKNSKEILSKLSSFILFVMVILLAREIFSLFKVDKAVSDFIKSLWTFEIPIGQIRFTIGNIFTLIITLWFTNLLSKAVSAVLEQDVLKKFRFKRGVPRTISTLAKYAILIIGFLIAASAAGMELSSLTIIIGALGVGIGFGLQDVINNFISGLILLFERPIQVGDTVQVDQLWGTVRNIGIRSSVIRAFDGSEVIVPNSMLISREVTNWTLSDQKRRLEIEVGVEYGTDLNKVLKILTDCAKKNKSVMDDPAPTAWFSGFGDSSINFRLVFWHPEFDGSLTVKSEVAISVFNQLSKEGITIPFPQQDVYIKEMKQNENDIEKPHPDIKDDKNKKAEEKNRTNSLNQETDDELTKPKKTVREKRTAKKTDTKKHGNEDTKPED